MGVTEEPLVQKKTLSKLSRTANEFAASKPSALAVNFLKKLGWKEGEGLGKDRQGRATHVKVVKKSDNLGIGARDVNVEDFSAQWWSHSFSSASSKLKSIGAGSASDSDSDSDSESSSNSDSDSDEEAIASVSLKRDMSTYTEEDRALFLACKGRRCGKRAGASQVGKWKREQRADKEFQKKLVALKDSCDEKVLFKEVATKSIVHVEGQRLQEKSTDKKTKTETIEQVKPSSSKKRKRKIEDVAESGSKKSMKKTKKEKKSKGRKLKGEKLKKKSKKSKKEKTKEKKQKKKSKLKTKKKNKDNDK